MPSKPRTPINYEATTGRMFRPASEVQAERDVLERDETEHDDVTNERTNEQIERRVIRHSFDIYHDQLMQLGEIQMRRYRETGKKPKLGHLVQEALDSYIAGQEGVAESR